MPDSAPSVEENAVALEQVLTGFDGDSKGHKTGQRDRGTGFEKLALIYLQNEPKFAELYSEVLPYADWAKKQGRSAQDVGIDLVGIRADGSGCDAIQAKFYAPETSISRKDVDSFLVASQQGFVGRRLIATTDKFGNHAREALLTANPSVLMTSRQSLAESVIDWRAYLKSGKAERQQKKTARPEQQKAIDKTLKALGKGTYDEPMNGRLLMACGTGKTLTSLKIAEKFGQKENGEKGMILFMAPSLALISQTLTEWTQQSDLALSCFAVCSDSKIGKKEDDFGQPETDLDYPATTNAKDLKREIQKIRTAYPERMIVVFSTYQSSGVVAEVQKNGLGAFDLVICDEAHRTSGGTPKNDEERSFQLIHRPQSKEGAIKRARTLFMTATPKIFSGEALEKAKDIDATLYSMDDEKLYGPLIHEISFSEAVKLGRLCPYKIVVLGVPEKEVAEAVPEMLRQKDNNLTLDIASRIIGAWKGLSRDDMRGENKGDKTEILPMKRALAFCSVIEPSKRGGREAVSSKVIANNFAGVADEYRKRQGTEKSGALCEVKHVDGSMNAFEKGEALAWLREAVTPKKDAITGQEHPVCRILSNVRCLSEGVDVPTLDAAIFLSPRSSEVDVVQSVGRVMRTAKGKERGYIIIPVVVPEGKSEEEYFTKGRDNPFRTVWMVLQALRAHDSSLEDELDRVNLGGNPDYSKMEVVCVSPLPAVENKSRAAARKLNETLGSDANPKERKPASKIKIHETPEEEKERLTKAFEQASFIFDREKLEDALYAKIVKKVGNRNPFERWSKDVRRVVERHISAINRLLFAQKDLMASSGQQAASQKAFDVFTSLKKELHDSVNPNIPDEEIVEMLAQHLVTGPVFDALFGEDGGHAKNPLTQALNNVIAQLHENGLAKEQTGLGAFYDSIRARLKDAPPAVKQNLTVQLYNDFFKTAFKSQADKLGVVYTPIPLVDFILRSVEWALQKNFGQGMGDESVSVLDPFTGTGTFISQLIGLRYIGKDGEVGDFIIPTDKLRDKYLSAKKEDAILGKPGLWANEIVLLAYYVAGVSIQAAYEARTGEAAPFGGLCLTDTFNLTENIEYSQREAYENGYLKDNSERILAEESAPIRVIVGNPPYNVDKNYDHPALTKRIEQTYILASNASLTKSLRDSYIKALRWASDRIKEKGVIGFVTNAGFIETAAGAGVRKCLKEEFSEIYIFHLRGNQRTSGEESRKEGGKIFGGGSRAPVAISILIKNPAHKGKAKIHYCDIGDYLTAKEEYGQDFSIAKNAPLTDKFHYLANFASIEHIPEKASDKGAKISVEAPSNPKGLFRRWQIIEPDESGDWLRQRDKHFQNFIPMGNKKSKKVKTIFDVYSNGIKTNRDAWVWNFSSKELKKSVERQVVTYEKAREYFHALNIAERKEILKDLQLRDNLEIAWAATAEKDLLSDIPLSFEQKCLVTGNYRPFTKEILYFSRRLCNSVYQLPKLFPYDRAENLVIAIVLSNRMKFSCLMGNSLPDLGWASTDGSQCFPLYYYEERQTGEGLFAGEIESGELKKCEAISDEGLKIFQDAYPSLEISKENLFYYIYGLLHSTEYRTKYGNSLARELPHIPRVKTAEDFTSFMQAGRKLSELHVNYEGQPEFRHLKITGEEKKNLPPEKLYRVEKMRLGKGQRFSASEKITEIIYNDFITLSDVPSEIWEYEVNGRSAVRWVMERQAVTTDKRSGITNDANEAPKAKEDPRWPLSLLLRVMTVAVETQKIIKNLPKFEILEG